VVTVVAAWMLDPVVCAGMEMGPPRVSVTALVDLQRVLGEQGIGRTFLGDTNGAQEEDDEITEGDTADDTAPTEHAVGLREAPRHELLRAQDSGDAARPPPDGSGGRRRRVCFARNRHELYPG